MAYEKLLSKYLKEKKAKKGLVVEAPVAAAPVKASAAPAKATAPAKTASAPPKAPVAPAKGPAKV